MKIGGNNIFKDVIIYITSNSNKNLLQIFDENKKIVETYIHNSYIFRGKINRAYGIKIFSDNNYLSSSFYIPRLMNKPYYFSTVKNNSPKIIVRLLDKNYSNLKIEKGEITLWQTLIQ